MIPAGANRFLDRLQGNLSLGPDRPFCTLVGADGERKMSWADLRRGCAAFQHGFTTAGLTRGGIVLIFLRHSPDLYAAFFGAMTSGLAPSFMPPTSPKQAPVLYWNSHRELLARIRPAAIVVDAFTLAEMRQSGLDLGQTAIFETHAIWSAFDAAGAPDLAVVPRSGSEIALLQHSSGTTGLKKGVALSFDAIVAQIDSYSGALGLGADDCIVSWLPLYHDMGLIACCITPAFLATPIVQIDAFTWLANPGMLFEQIGRRNGTFCWLPNFAFEHLAAIAGRRADTYDLSKMKAFINCSEVCKAQTFDKFLAAFARSGLRSEQLHCCYAMAETVFAVSQTKLDRPPLRIRVAKESLDPGSTPRIVAADEAGVDLIETGALIAGVAVAVYDENRGALPDGCVGEIGVAADFLFSGYNEDPERSAAHIRDGVYFTRDLGFVHRSELFVLGRVDDLVIINGRNIYAHEVEAVVARVDGVKAGRAVAVAQFDPRMGSEVLVIICERRAGATRPDSGIRDEIVNVIFSIFNVTPRRVLVVDEGWLVKTTSGKISRKENLAKLASMKA